jgi:hypothetical protein
MPPTVDKLQWYRWSRERVGNLRRLGVVALPTEDALNKVFTIRLTMDAADDVPTVLDVYPRFLGRDFRSAK